MACIVIVLLLITYKIFSIFVAQVGLAERALTKYANEILDIDEKIICKYDWYNDRYNATNNLGFALDYRRQNKTIHDGNLSQKENEKASKAYKDLVINSGENLVFPIDITVWTEISASNYDIKTQRLYLLGIYNSEDISEKDSISRATNIVMDTIKGLGEDYNFTGIQAIYFDKNGMFEISFPADSFKAIDTKKLLSKTKQKGKSEYPETYINWLKENNF